MRPENTSKSAKLELEVIIRQLSVKNNNNESLLSLRHIDTLHNIVTISGLMFAIGSNSEFSFSFTHLLLPLSGKMQGGLSANTVKHDKNHCI